MRWTALLLMLSLTEASADEPWVQNAEGPVYFAVDVSDIDAAAAWYWTLFGVDVIDDTTADDGRWRIANLGNDTFAIELIWDRRSSAADDGARHHGFRKLGIGVSDVRAVADRVEATTGERPRIVEFERHGLRLLQLHDPDGNTIQLQSPLEDTESDEAILLRMHRDVIRFHLDNDVESWLASEGDDYVSANGGGITFPTLEERRAQRGPYLARTTFTEYRDLVDPVIRVSDDGTLGWVICQVQMAGTQRGEDGDAVPIGSVWAWIELYEKHDGAWRLIGNVSNRRGD